MHGELSGVPGELADGVVHDPGGSLAEEDADGRSGEGEVDDLRDGAHRGKPRLDIGAEHAGALTLFDDFAEPLEQSGRQLEDDGLSAPRIVIDHFADEEPGHVRVTEHKLRLGGDQPPNGIGRLGCGLDHGAARRNQAAYGSAQHRPVQLFLAREVVVQQRRVESGRRADLLDRGAVVTLGGEQPLRGIEDQVAGGTGGGWHAA